MNCYRCNKRLVSSGDTNGVCQDCRNAEYADDLAKQLGINRGWACPRCGVILSPYKDYCKFCAPEQEFTHKYDPPFNWCGEQAIGCTFDE